MYNDSTDRMSRRFQFKWWNWLLSVVAVSPWMQLGSVTLLTGCGSGDVKFVRAPVVALGELRRLEGHDEPVHALAFSSDEKWALSGCGNTSIVNGKSRVVQDHSIRLWDVETGRELRRFAGHPEWVQAVAFSPDSRLAISAGWDQLLRLWDVETGKEIRTFKGHGHLVWSVAWFNDGQRVISCGGDSTVRVWNVQTGDELQRFGPEVRSITSVELSPDQQYVLAGGNWGKLWLWEIATGNLIRTFDHGRAVHSVRYLPDGRRAVSSAAHSPIVLWDVTTGNRIREFHGHKAYEIYCSNFTPDGRRFLSCGGDQTMRLWDVETGNELHCYSGFPDGLNCVVISSDGRFALSGGGGRRPGSLDYTIRLWELSKVGAKEGHGDN
jgi:WD40 repeat protein